ncbi:MAG TPA: glycosyltransferase [Glaciibacter sp.]|nr:glycosyltransferase [Glaciibacter sp.]
MMMPSPFPVDRTARPRRVLFVVSSLHGGGAEFVARTWMEWLSGRGHAVSVVLTSSDVDTANLPAGVRAKTLARHAGQLAKAGGLRTAILETAPDAVISLQTHPNLVLLTAVQGLPRDRRPKVLISERNLVSLGLAGSPVSHRVKIWTAKRLYRLADHVIAISHPVAGELVAGFGVREGRITVVPNPATAKVGASSRGRVAGVTSDGHGAGSLTTATDVGNSMIEAVADGDDADRAVFAASVAGAVAAASDVATEAGITETAANVENSTIGAVLDDRRPDRAVFATNGTGAARAAGPTDAVSATAAGAAGLTGTAGAADPATSARGNRRPGSDQGIQIVLACRLVVQKRPLLAIAAAAELQRRGIPVEVVSFGGGPMLADVVAAATAAGVTFRHEGWVENWFEHFGDNAVALLPSSREGFGNVLVEAAAAGYPSVAVSGALGVADAIVPGITGELALSAEPADLADALLRASELTLADIDPWLRRFSAESSGADLERVLEYTLRDPEKHA